MRNSLIRCSKKNVVVLYVLSCCDCIVRNINKNYGIGKQIFVPKRSKIFKRIVDVLGFFTEPSVNGFDGG